MAINLDDQFVTVTITDVQTNETLYTQEVPGPLVARFLLTFDFAINKDIKYKFDIKTKNQNTLGTF